jgi:hypothetical protein
MSLMYNTANDEEDLEQYDRSLSKEAERVANEIRREQLVEFAEVSSVLESTNSIAYLNIGTFEKQNWCVELTATGYLVVANKFDHIDPDIKESNLKQLNKYETVEALMNSISPLFIEKFNKSVAERLEKMIK